MDALSKLRSAVVLAGGSLVKVEARKYRVHAPLGGMWTKNGEKAFEVEWGGRVKRSTAINKAVRIVEHGVKRSPGRPPAEQPRENKTIRVLPVVKQFMNHLGNRGCEDLFLNSTEFKEWHAQQ